MTVKNNTSDRGLDLNLDYVKAIERSDGSVSYRIRKRDARGKEQSKTVIPPEGLSERAKRKWLSEEVVKFIDEVDMGYANSDAKTTLSKYFDTVFVRKKRPVIRSKTLHDYISLFDRLMRSDIGAIQLGKITKLDILEFYQDLGERGVGDSTIRAIHRLLSAMLNSAMEDYIIPRNVAAGKNIAPRKKVADGKSLTEYEVMRVIECLEKEPVIWQNLIMLMMHTGCRRGEIAGLRWEDVDLTRNTVHIRHSLVYTPHQGLVLEDAKSEMSHRYIPLFEEDADALMLMYRDCHMGFVFAMNGDPERPVFPDAITRYLNKFCKKYDLPHFSPHVLRRTMPTLMITRFKADPKTMQTLLGHSNVSTTLGYYTMVSDDDRRKAIGDYGRYTKQIAEDHEKLKREEARLHPKFEDSGNIKVEE